MCQGARYIDEARRDATTRRRDDATTRRRDDATTRRRDDATTQRRDDATTRRRDDATTRRLDDDETQRRRETRHSATTWRGDETGWDATTRGRETTQQPTK
jgi:hypothetical protein